MFIDLVCLYIVIYARSLSAIDFQTKTPTKICSNRTLHSNPSGCSKLRAADVSLWEDIGFFKMRRKNRNWLPSEPIKFIMFMHIRAKLPDSLKRKVATFSPQSTLPETNKSHLKMVGRQSFPFGFRPIFRGELLVLEKVTLHTCQHLQKENSLNSNQQSQWNSGATCEFQGGYRSSPMELVLS